MESILKKLYASEVDQRTSNCLLTITQEFVREIQEFNDLNQERDTGEILPDDVYGGPCNKKTYPNLQ